MACKLAAAMMMSQYDKVNDEVMDAMGEVANMVIGGVKTRLEEIVGAMAMGIRRSLSAQPLSPDLRSSRTGSGYRSNAKGRPSTSKRCWRKVRSSPMLIVLLRTVFRSNRRQ